MRKKPNLVGYIKAKRQRSGSRTDDVDKQVDAIREYADHGGYEIAEIFYEEQVLDFDKKKNFNKLTEALTLCNKKNASFIYVELGPWRHNAIFYNFVQNYHRRIRKARLSREVIAIHCPEIIDLIKRQSREEKIFTKDGAARSRRHREEQREIDEKRDPSLIWKRVREVGAKQFNNFKHLTNGSEPIYQVIQNHAGLSSKEIARLLNQGHYLTVDGKRWTGDNVRKTQQMMKKRKFKDFEETKKRKWKGL